MPIMFLRSKKSWGRQLTRTAVKHLIAGIALVLLAAQPLKAEGVQLEEEHGVYMVPVRINDAITIPFVLDSGAGDILVPEDVFKTLIRSRTVAQSDFLAPGNYVLGDGSCVLSQRFVILYMKCAWVISSSKM